jgi:hypothetical protein
MDPILQQLQIEIDDAVQGLDSTQTQATPTARLGKWSIQQIVQHLCLTYASTSDVIETRLAKGRPTQAKPNLQQRVAQIYVTRLGLFPHGRNAPEDFVPPRPAPSLSGNDLTCSVAEHLARVDNLLNKAEAFFGPGPCITHFVLGPLSVRQWRRFHLVHGTHHVRQILAIRASHNL